MNRYLENILLWVEKKKSLLKDSYYILNIIYFD